MPEFTSHHCPDAHMVAQIRAKQLATKSTQDRLKIALQEALESNSDQSGAGFAAEFSGKLSTWLKTVQETNTKFTSGRMTDVIGTPIKFNKTAVQLNIVKEWVESRGDNIADDLQKGTLHNGLNNEVPSRELPRLGAESISVYWGNENSSVSTVLLYSAAHSLQIAPDKNQLVGAATFYPFVDVKYSLDGIEPNPFFSADGALLFGDYQFRGHRYFSREHPGIGQFLFAPEDCSSATAKATGLTEQQLRALSIESLHKAYNTPGNEYGYQAITFSANYKTLDFDKIEPGDFVLIGGHTAIIADKDNRGNITTFEFNCDINRPENKILGGGINQRNLIQDTKNGAEVHVMRSSRATPGESIASEDLIGRIDAVYHEGDYAKSHVDVSGDCSVFLVGENAGAAACGSDLGAD